MQTLSRIPDQIEAGTTVEYTRTYSDFPSDDGWTLQLHLKGASAVDKPFTAVPGTKDFTITLAVADTQPLIAGVYAWSERATKAGKTYNAASGTLEVLVDVGAATAGALQSWEEKALAIVEKVIAFKEGATPAEQGRLSTDIQEYEIAGRRVVKLELKELWSIRDDLRRRLRTKLKPGRLVTPVRTTFTGQIRP